MEVVSCRHAWDSLCLQPLSVLQLAALLTTLLRLPGMQLLQGVCKAH